MIDRGRLLSFAATLLLAGAACGPAKSGTSSARPVPSPRGTPISASFALSIGPSGGTISSADSPPTLTATVPADAVPTPVDFTTVEITSTAPGSIQTVAYRLGPEGTVFGVPVTLELLVKNEALDLNELTVAFQDSSGYWVRYQEVQRDLVNRKLRVTTTHLSDWSIVTGTSARDLRGSFSIDSTIGIPFRSTGNAFLDYAAEDAQKVYYLLWGDITLTNASLAIGTDTCTADVPTMPLPTNVAEVTKGALRFDWGASGHWDLSCTSSGVPAPAELLTTAFDTVGLSLIGCARGYAGTPFVGADHLSSGGSFTVSCGPTPPPDQTVTWDFVNPSCGGPCTTQPDTACHVGVVECSSGVETCVSGAAVADGTTCNDGNACTVSDSCQAGICTGASPVACNALDQCHDMGVCDPATGACSNPAKLDGTACNDADACTPTDTCHAGVCTGSSPVVCSALDQCHEVGICNPATGVCSDPAKLDGSACSDGDACTQTDTCLAGICTGANPIVCAALDQCHDAGVCNPATGACSTPAKLDGMACSDGNACTQTDTCLAGICTGANPITCPALDECHVAGACDPATAVCSKPTQPDGTICAGGTCLAGTCARTVSGQRLVTSWTDAGPQTPVAPADVSPAALLPATVAAYRPDANGTRIAGSLDAMGGYSIPGVPVGSYLLVVTDGDGLAHAVQTSASSVDLGWDVLGRPDATPAPAGTSLTVDVTSLASWDTAPGADDQLQLTSADADVWDLAVQGAQLSSTSGSWTEDWAASAAGGPQNLLAAADVLWAHHLAKRTTVSTPAFDYRSATFAMSPASLDMTVLPPLTLPVSFPAGSPSPAMVAQSGTIDVASWDLPSFEAFLSAMSPSPLDPVHALRVAASIHALSSPAPAPRNGSPDLLLLEIPAPVPPATSSAVAPGLMAYGQFLPATWLEWLGVELTAMQSYLLAPASNPFVERVSLGHREAQPPPPVPPATPPPLSLGPTLSPVTSIRIVPGAVTNISWVAPALGRPSSYTVDLYLLQSQGASTTSARVATLTIGHSAEGPQQLAIPAGVLATGSTYYARVTAHADAPDAFDTQPLRRANVGTWAGALTATFVAH